MHVGSYAQSRGVGFLPIIATALPVAMSIYKGKKDAEAIKAQEKAAIAAAQAQARAERQKSKSTRNMLLIGGGIVVAGALAFLVFRKRKGSR